MPSRKARADAASSSSIFESAKPTWIRTQSPGASGSSASRPMLMTRLTPLTLTRARSGWSGRNSTTSPGMPRHMTVHPLVRDQFQDRAHGAVDRGGDRFAQADPRASARRFTPDDQHPTFLAPEHADHAEHDVRLHPVRVEERVVGLGRLL